MTLLEAASEQKAPPRGWIALNVGMTCGSNTYLLGGTIGDMGIVFLISLSAYLVTAGFERTATHQVFSVAVGAIWITAWALIASQFIPGVSIDTDIVGAIMFYVPGITIANGIRDITSGNLITGAVRLLDALLVALILAFGVSRGAKVAIF